MQNKTLEASEAVGARRRMPIGAEPQASGGVHFRVWAPQSESVEVLIGRSLEWDGTVETHALMPEEDGYFSGLAPECRDGAYYKFRLDSGEFPDPASRFQPRGPHGPSQVIEPGRFRWTDQNWKGVRPEGQILYEMHIGTFTSEGTYMSAMAQLPELARLGITVIELMPLADFPGRFGWGYDGVDLFAPTRLYGTPDELRTFIDRAHALGLGVILDVVYNHFGPDGNYLREFSANYITDRHANEWGQAINFDGEQCGAVREFFTANAVYWIDEFHFDGYRFDATQQINDDSDDHILAVITRKTREAAGERAIFLAAENEQQNVILVRSPEEHGYGMDAVWNDDFHHAATVAAVGHCEAYYLDYKGSPQEFISAMKRGYLYQGQWYNWQQKRRGTPSYGLTPEKFINFVQNHDQVANSLRGQRIHELASPGVYRALTALLLLGTGTPLLFQGQEFAATSPFLYFADHNAGLSKLVNEGRREFLRQFPSIASPEAAGIPLPAESEQTFERSKLDPSERQRRAPFYRLHEDLIALRKGDPVFQAPKAGQVDGAVLGPDAFVLRFFGGSHGDRLLAVNLGADLQLRPAPEPLLAPPMDHVWRVRWSSENPAYGGNGIAPTIVDDNWLISGKAAVVLDSELNALEALSQSRPRKMRRTA